MSRAFRLSWVVVFLAVVLLYSGPVSGRVYQTDDAIVVEALGSLAEIIPTVPIDSNIGLPQPNFPWWLYYPFRQTNITTTTTTTTTTIPQVNPGKAKRDGGVGPHKTLNIDEQERIVGGTDSVKNSWPSIAALLNNDRQFCGGSLMDSHHIITAAHCVAHMSSWDVSRLTVALGMYKLKPDQDPEMVKKVSRVTYHKGFDPSTLRNDVAVLTLESPVQFTPTISPVLLPVDRVDSIDHFSNKRAAVVGWGATKESRSQSSVLRQETVKIITNEECARKYDKDAPGGIPEHMFCASHPENVLCSDDSGGPLFVQDAPGSPWIQTGIINSGIGCFQPNYPGVYTRVTSFIEWIKKNTKTL